MTSSKAYNDIIKASSADHLESFSYINTEEFRQIYDLTLNMIYSSTNNGGCIFTCGNGGSFSDSMHFTAELMVRYVRDRRPIKSITLGSNLSCLSACSNDYSYDQVFKRDYEALSNDNDTLIAISTSGQSKNILNVINYASSINRKWILLTSNRINEEPKGGLIVKFPFTTTAAIQECHIFYLHLICRGLDSLILGPE